LSSRRCCAPAHYESTVRHLALIYRLPPLSSRWMGHNGIRLHHCAALHCTALRCAALHTSSRFKQMRSVGANCCSAALTRSASPRFSDATNTSVSCTNGGLLVVRRTIGGTDPPHQRTYLPCSTDRFSCCASTLSTPRLCLRVQPNRANTECSHVRAAEWPQRSSLGLTVPIDSCE